jgi:hypothetical protein
VNELIFSSFDTEVVQPALVRKEKELALRADYRRRAIKTHVFREAKRMDREFLKRRALHSAKYSNEVGALWVLSVDYFICNERKQLSPWGVT